MITAPMNRRPYDMQNELLQRIFGSIIAPVVVIGIVSLVGLQIKQSFDSGASLQHDKNVDKKLDNIEIEIKENRLERIQSYNKLYDSYDLLNNKVDKLNYRANYHWPKTTQNKP